MILTNLEGHLAVWNLSNSHTSGNIAYIKYDMLAHKSESVHIAWNFKYRTKIKELTIVHWKSGNISKRVHDRDVDTTDH